MPQPYREYVSAKHRVALRRLPNAFIQVYHGRATGELLQEIRRLQDPESPDARSVSLLVIRPKSARDAPDEDFRKGGAALMKERGQHVVAAALVIAIDGFVGAAARAVLAGMNAFSSNRELPQKSFGSVEDAARWLADSAPGLGVTAEMLTQHVEEMEATLRR